MIPGMRIRVPGSTANLGPGFDTLGMALPLFMTLEVYPSSRTRVILDSPQLAGLPEDEENLVVKMMKKVMATQGKELPPVEVRMASEIPLTRGVGSSAAAVVAGLLAGNGLMGNPLTHQEILDMATAVEGHPDNVAASLYGGIVVNLWDGRRARCQKITPPPGLHVTLAVPDFHLSTEKARGVLPDTYSRADAIFNISHTGYLVAALLSSNWQEIGEAMQDRLHQPYRAPLIPGLKEILQGAKEYGALGCALSGAGPSVLALSHGPQPQLAAFMENCFRRHNIGVTVYHLTPWVEGAVQEVLEESAS